MLKVFFGDDRLGAEAEIKRQLGEDFEIIEGENLTPQDLPNIFQGASLFNVGKRRILLKNACENAAVWEQLAKYRETEADVIVWELKLDKRLAGYKSLKDAGVDLREFAAKAPDTRIVFGILDLALDDGEKAVARLREIEETQDPFMFFGLLVSQAMKKFDVAQGAREQRILKMLAEIDLQMKTTAIEPWRLIESFLLRVKCC